MCYFASWQVHRESYGGNFSIRKIDPQLCTHIVLAFQGMNELTNKIESIDSYTDYELGGQGKYFKEVCTIRLIGVFD
jgi:chitinase